MLIKVAIQMIIFCSFLTAAVENVTAIHQYGQTFISWKEVIGATKYNVYQSTQPIASVSDLAANKIRIVVDSGFATNPELKSLSAGENEFGSTGWTRVTPKCVINRNVIVPLNSDSSGLAKPVDEGYNLVVLTSHATATYYYAVTAISGSNENKSLGATSSSGPVQESTYKEPHAYLIWQSKSKLARMYLQYSDIDSINSKRYAWPYWVGYKRISEPKDTCRLWIELQGGNQQMLDIKDSLTDFETGFSGHDVIIKPDENMELWFGHSSTFQRNIDDVIAATSGPIINYTQARVMDFIRYLTHSDPYFKARVDTNRISVGGCSNGGCGTLQFYYNYPHVFATAFSTCGPTDITRYNVDTYTPLFGNFVDTTIKVSFRGWNSEYLRKNFEGYQSRVWFNFESQVLKNENVSLPFLYIGYGGEDQTIPWPEWGKQYITNLHKSRRGFCGGLEGPSGHYDPSIPAVPQFRTIRLNESYPAFTNVSGNPTIPLVDNPGSATFEINNKFMWSTKYWSVGGYTGQIDNLNHYEIVIASTTADQTGDITPRRLQKFFVVPGAKYLIKNRAVKDTSIKNQNDTIISADQMGLITIQKFLIKKGDQNSGGSKLSIISLDSTIVRGQLRSSAESNRGLKFSLNPSSNNNVFITYQADAGIASATVTISDLKGKVVKTLNTPLKGVVEWETQDQAAGSYIITLRHLNLTQSLMYVLSK